MKATRRVLNLTAWSASLGGVVILVAATSLLCSTAGGAIIVTPASNASDNTWFDSNASNTDLVNAGSATLLGTATITPVGFGAGGHNNGVAANNGTDSTFFWNSNLPGTITYTLDTSVNTAGYDITRIRSIAGWGSNSTTHANQDFDIEVSLVGSGSFTNIQTATFLPFNGTPPDANKSSMVTVTDGTGVIASGVDQLRFTYRQTGTWGAATGLVLRELDVEGAATGSPPPPSSAPISATGWNVDFVLGSGETHAAHQKPENANIWFADNIGITPGGILASGAVSASGRDFQMEAFTGGGNNALRSTAATNTLTLNTPAKFSELSLLGSNTGGSSTATWEIVLNFTDAPSTAPLTYTAFGSWAGSGPELNPKLTGNGSTSAFGGQLNSRTFDLAAMGLSDFTLSSIDFSSTGGAGGNLAVFGLSGIPSAPAGEIPEPATMALLGLAACGLSGYLRRRRTA